MRETGRQREREREEQLRELTHRTFGVHRSPVSLSVRDHLFASHCVAELLNREMSRVLYVSDAPLLTSAHKKTGECAV